MTITNRTFSRAEELAALFAHTGSVAAVALEDLAGHEFDLVINATSSGINGDPGDSCIPVHSHIYAYDMFYQKENAISDRCEQQGQNMWLMVWACWWGRRLMRCYSGMACYLL